MTTALLPETGRPAELNAAPVGRIGGNAAAIAAAREVARRLALAAGERDRDRLLPEAEIATLTRGGLFALTVPRALGGPEVSTPALAEVFAIIAAADGSIGQIPQSHYYMLEVVRLAGTPEQQARIFARVRDGMRIANALTERGAPLARDVTTRLTATAGRLLLNGIKYYSTGALLAHWLAVVALDDDGRRVVAFVPAEAPGVVRRDDWTGFGQRTTGSGTTELRDVPVDPANVVRQHLVFDVPTRMGPFAQVLHAAIDVGIARGALAAAIEVVRTRARPWADSFVARAADDPYIVAGLGDVRVRLAGAEALLHRSARAVDDVPEPATAEQVAVASLAVAEAKVAAAEAALLASSKLIEFGGSRATAGELALDRYWRDARTHTVHDPVRWKLHAIGRHALSGILPPRSGTL